MISFIEILFSTLWGLLIGFIGWGACFRLPEPISAWLLQSENPKGIVIGIARLLIVLFLIFAVLAALSWVPIMLSVTQFSKMNIETDFWRNLYGISFISSLVGFFVLGFLRRFS